MKNNLGAFITHDRVEISGAPEGPLCGLNFAVKDVFDMAGHITGNGNPDWFRTHSPATSTAHAVTCLLQAGAYLAGKTNTDELAFSLSGENAHYGTPVNPRAPDRIPGGSSSGSVSAVASGDVDFALGSDCGGSVRLPASLCGIFGFRPSHGLISTEGIIPLAQSFDTVGWFARDAALLERVGEILLTDYIQPLQPNRMLIATDAFQLVDNAASKVLQPEIDKIASSIPAMGNVTVSEAGLACWMEDFRTIQGAEAWANHHEWITRVKPSFGPGVKERFQKSAQIDPACVTQANLRREQIAARLDDMLPQGTILCLPTAPGIAPLKNSAAHETEIFRSRALSLLCIAGLARLPQASLPLGALDGCPMGLSLIARRGDDALLLTFVRSLYENKILKAYTA